MKSPQVSRRFVIWASLVVLITYAIWIGGPYLRSIVVRDAAAMQHSLEDARLTLDRTRSELSIAQKQLDAAQQVFDDAQRLFDRQQSADAIALPGGIVWSHVVAEGSAVTQGSPVTTWIDCRVMLVDAAVSDAELSLVRLGAPANVVLEGERRSRQGTVLLMRGGAATLGGADLAAVAKGRRPGVVRCSSGSIPRRAT